MPGCQFAQVGQIMAKRGRTSYVMSNSHRDKIRDANILNALIEFTKGEREMSAAQASVGVALLKKIMPDLSNMQVEGNPDSPITSELKVTIVRPDAK